MKQLLLLAFLFTSAISFGQKNASADAQVKDIQAEFKRINSTKLKQQNHGIPDGNIAYYLENNQVVKIIWMEGEQYSTYTSECYFKAGKLFFEVETSEEISEDEKDPKTTTTVSRTYVYNDQVIKYTVNGKPAKSKVTHFTPSSLEYKVLKAHKTKKYGVAVGRE